MPVFGKQYTFVPNTTISPDEVNTNFDDIATFLNSQVMHLDGSKTMTGALTLSGAPTQDLHAATKLYVDGKLGARSIGGKTNTVTNGAGDVTITHNLNGDTAVTAVVTGGAFFGGVLINVVVMSTTTTQATLRFTNSATGAALANTSVGFHWIAQRTS